MIKPPNRRVLAGSGKMTGLPPMSQFKRVIELIKTCFEPFLKHVTKNGISNENGLNRQLSIHISNISYFQNLPFFSNSEAMENEANGNSPAADIGIFLKTDDMAESPQRITVFEGKRLSKSLGNARKKEYVIGHEKKGKHVPCGGIERFKKSIHGRNFKYAGIIGYIQDESSSHWIKAINSWINELSNSSNLPAWKKTEALSQVKNEGKVSELSSTVVRESDKLYLTHLWIDLQS